MYKRVNITEKVTLGERRKKWLCIIPN